jgi:hypothetical protein
MDVGATRGTAEVSDEEAVKDRAVGPPTALGAGGGGGVVGPLGPTVAPLASE